MYYAYKGTKVMHSPDLIVNRRESTPLNWCQIAQLTIKPIGTLDLKLKMLSSAIVWTLSDPMRSIVLC